MTQKQPSSCHHLNGHSITGEDAQHLLRPLWEFPVHLQQDASLNRCPTRTIRFWPDDLTPENFRSELESGEYVVEVYEVLDAVSNDQLVDIGLKRGKVMPGSLGLACLCHPDHAEKLPQGLIVSPHAESQRFFSGRREKTPLRLMAAHYEPVVFEFSLVANTKLITVGTYVIYYRILTQS
ncbi:MAG: hypothetical protein RL094_441 [Candidatus Parcubacteria bacterium]|jgi:hypothetical protein